MTIRTSSPMFLTVLDPVPAEDVGWWVDVYSFPNPTTLLARIYDFTSLNMLLPISEAGTATIDLSKSSTVFDHPLSDASDATGIYEHPKWFFASDGGAKRFAFFTDKVNRKTANTDGDDMVTISCSGIVDVFSWAVVLPDGVTNASNRDFPSTTWAGVFIVLFNEAKARGTIPSFVTLGFTAANDSNGVPWPVADFSVNVGYNLFSILQNFRNSNSFEFTMTAGGTLIASQAYGTDVSDTVRFFEGYDVDSAEEAIIFSDVHSDVFVEDQIGQVAHASDTTVAVDFGKREAYVNYSSTRSSGSAHANRTLRQLSKALRSNSYNLSYDPRDASGNPTGKRVFVDYTLGDTIGIGQRDGTDNDFKVVSIALNITPDGEPQLELVLNDKQALALEKLRRAIEYMLQDNLVTDSNASNTDLGRSMADQEISYSPIGDLANVDETTSPPIGGDFLTYDGTNWTPDSPSINALGDVNTTSPSPTIGDALAWNGTNWVPTNPSTFPGGGGGGGGGSGGSASSLAEYLAVAHNYSIPGSGYGYLDNLDKLSTYSGYTPYPTDYSSRSFVSMVSSDTFQIDETGVYILYATLTFGFTSSADVRFDVRSYFCGAGSAYAPVGLVNFAMGGHDAVRIGGGAGFGTEYVTVRVTTPPLKLTSGDQLQYYYELEHYSSISGSLSFASVIADKTGLAIAKLLGGSGSGGIPIVDVAVTSSMTVPTPGGTAADGDRVRYRFHFDSGGPYTLTWPSVFSFGSDVTTSLVPTAANSEFEMIFTYYSTNTEWRAMSIARGF